MNDESRKFTFVIEPEDDGWRASVMHADGSTTASYGDNPLAALTNLIVALAEKGFS